MESASAAIPTYLDGRSSSAPHSNPVHRTPNLYDIHACKEGGKTQNTEEAIKRSMSMKKCEDKGKLIIRIEQSKLQAHIFFDWINTLRGIYPPDLFAQVQNHLCPKLNTAALFVLPNLGNNLKGNNRELIK